MWFVNCNIVLTLCQITCMIHRKVYYHTIAKTTLSLKKHNYKTYIQGISAYCCRNIAVLCSHDNLRFFSTNVEILNHYLFIVFTSSKDIKPSPPACISSTCACLSAYHCDIKHTNLLILTLTLWQRRVLPQIETLRHGLCGCWASLCTEGSWCTGVVWLTWKKI